MGETVCTKCVLHTGPEGRPRGPALGAGGTVATTHPSWTLGPEASDTTTRNRPQPRQLWAGSLLHTSVLNHLPHLKTSLGPSNQAASVPVPTASPLCTTGPPAQKTPSRGGLAGARRQEPPGGSVRLSPEPRGQPGSRWVNAPTAELCSPARRSPCLPAPTPSSGSPCPQSLSRLMDPTGTHSSI